ncbi:hypothetical protein HDE_04262 [Halotydeus destructor]|nr:hypothetical protein HDE_04262 [Halotydeus destructor]
MNVALSDIVSCLNRFLETENVINLQEARDLSRFYIEDIGRAMSTMSPVLMSEISRSNTAYNSLLFCLLHYLNDRDVNYQKLIKSQFTLPSPKPAASVRDENILEKIETVLSQREKTVPKLDSEVITNQVISLLKKVIEEIRETNTPDLNPFCKELTVKLTLLLSRVDELSDAPDYSTEMSKIETRTTENSSLLAHVVEGIGQTIDSYREGMSLLSSNVGHMLHNLLTKQVDFHQQLLNSYRERLELQHSELRQQAFEKGRLSALVEAQEILLQRQRGHIEQLRNETSQFAIPDKNQELISRLESMLQHSGDGQDSKTETFAREACKKIQRIPGFDNLLKLAEPMEIEQNLWVTGARETVMDVSENHIKNSTQLESLFNFIFAMNLKFKKEADIQFERIRPNAGMTSAMTGESLLHTYTAAITMLVSMDFQLMSHIQNMEVAASIRASLVKLTTTFCLLYAFADQSQKEQNRRLELENELLQLRTKTIDSSHTHLNEKKALKATIDTLHKQLKSCQSEKSIAKDLYDKTVDSSDKQSAADLQIIGELRQQLKQLQEGAKFEGQAQLDECTMNLMKSREEMKNISSQNAELKSELDGARNALNRELKVSAEFKKQFEDSSMQVAQLNIWVETVEANERRLKEHIADLNQHLDPSIARRMDDVCKTITQNATEAVEKLMANKRPIDDEAEDNQRKKRMRTQTT